MSRVAALAVFFTVALAAALGLTVTAAQASVQSIDHGGTYVGDVIVEQGQTVDGDITVMFGDATIAGTVNGDVNVIGGSAEERPGAMITGQVNMLGDELTNEVVPWAPRHAMRDTYDGSRSVFWPIAWDVIVLLFFLIFPIRTRIALERLERHPGLCVTVGLLGWVAVIPLAGLLLVTILLIPLIPVEFVALVAFVCIGQGALCLLVGRRLMELINTSHAATPLAAFVAGLVLLSAAELVPVFGGLVTLLVGLVGLGAAILSFVNEASFAGPAMLGAGAPHTPIGGPPMPTA
jgi:hypothetical protein